MGFFSVFKTKTAWTGMALVGYGIVQITQGEDGIRSVIEGLGLIFLRSGVQKLKR